MDDSSEKKDRPTPARRTNKPLMEKRRRQRINDCLVQLKGLVLQAMNKDTTQYSKLEKADILEMTVKHLKLVQRQQISAAMATDPNVISKYRAGFNECAAEISRYLDTVNGGNPELKARVMNYLGNSMMQFPVIPVYQGVVPSYHIPMTSPATSHPAFPSYSHANNVFSAPHQHTLPQQQKQTLDYTQYPLSSDSAIKVEPLPVCSDDDLTSRVMSQTTSPVRRIPSPCDSDSGLSDSSFSHDENGNYSQYNINSDFRNEKEQRVQAEIEHRPIHYHSGSHRRISPKRKLDSINESSPKRLRVGSVVTSNSTHPRMGSLLPSNSTHPARDNDPMWRPW